MVECVLQVVNDGNQNCYWWQEYILFFPDMTLRGNTSSLYLRIYLEPSSLFIWRTRMALCRALGDLTIPHLSVDSINKTTVGHFLRSNQHTTLWPVTCIHNDSNLYTIMIINNKRWKGQCRWELICGVHIWIWSRFKNDDTCRVENERDSVL